MFDKPTIDDTVQGSFADDPVDDAPCRNIVAEFDQLRLRGEQLAMLPEWDDSGDAFLAS